MKPHLVNTLRQLAATCLACSLDGRGQVVQPLACYRGNFRWSTSEMIVALYPPSLLASGLSSSAVISSLGSSKSAMPPLCVVILNWHVAFVDTQSQSILPVCPSENVFRSPLGSRRENVLSPEIATLRLSLLSLGATRVTADISQCEVTAKRVEQRCYNNTRALTGWPSVRKIWQGLYIHATEQRGATTREACQGHDGVRARADAQSMHTVWWGCEWLRTHGV